MLTSYYAKWSKVFTPGGICISRTQRTYSHPIHAPLVPGAWSYYDLKPVEYIPCYQEQLDTLSAKTTWAELQEMATSDAVRRFGLTEVRASRVEPVLLCWETPGGTSAAFCHRRLVAQWLQSELGKIVPEGHVSSKGDRVTTPSFDTLCRIAEDGSFIRLDKETAQGQFSLNLF